MPGSGKAPLVVVGDALLDRDLTGTADRLAPDAPVPVVAERSRRERPGGAALAACLAARDGRDVTLVTGVGDDAASEELRRMLDGRVKVIGLPLTGALPEKTRVLAQGRPVVRLDRGDGRVREATDEAREAVRAAPAVLVSDYGRGAADALRDVLAERPPVVWDPHPRGGPPVPGTRLVTPARSEAHALAATAEDRDATGAPGGSDLRVAAREAAVLVRHWRAASVAVTMGARGALLSYGDHPLLVPAPAAHHGDTCGAGDRFAATAAGLLADGSLVGEAVEGAVAAATEFVAVGGAGGLADGPSPEADARPSGEQNTDIDAAPDPHTVIARVRAAGGTVVAAGGCFDLLHAGHVGLLQAARRIGDCLVVCLNSDASVRRRKGEGRPANPLADRIRVLLALECVDAVAVFDEDTPEKLLAELRPDVWIKGGDYTGADLPEAALLQEWGGQAVLLPYLAGRSSTALLDRAADRTR
ncbi:D-glycero-beta-D-manno-heptose 1-phosphate adenylyltransferase [Streptomyces sp. ISL-22]|uniref:D-glycero-beta-D-manno-heptose 1-phosphate adenylyltransferase n=1 Tax=unclassified Streptomyces TaxID=2593676 RepID=UPI001BEA1660|nr:MULTISPECIES: D-glycero-beta-D-manno-heptose 1-phosphate adenylyltransferase [unclassified Streptomyces]MBT2421851.1 D-glycero-beta-D-manno-heptose 1-phosphate adenylyltransferase [Streptomyces sp. ISL-24]MBT2438332.1 D-glycero-beta-D-manno-heptose 1-phosphate adenylyltransferase [Streptomyces sp. ISL-22]